MPLKYTPKDADKFWARVEVTDTCWYWTGHTSTSGHGAISIQGRIIGTHRFAYILAYGDIPDELDVCHTCDQPPCCRPDHLFLGTRAQNNHDRFAKGRVRGLRAGLDALLQRIRRPRPTFEERFWAKVEKTDSCWLWTGSLDNKGYGGIGSGGKYGEKLKVHRVSYELHYGPIPDGMVVCHTCDIPRCLNPAHLWLGTQKENMEDAVQKRRMAAGDQHYARRMPEKRQHGEHHSQAKLTERDVREIRHRYATEDVTLQDLANIYGVQVPAIHNIVKHKTWKHVD